MADWDPSKWVILTFAKLGVAWGLRRATPGDIAAARAHMLLHGHDHNNANRKIEIVEKDEGSQQEPTWTEAELKAYAERNGACVLLIDGYAVDVTGYIEAHVRPWTLLFFPIWYLLLMVCVIRSLGARGYYAVMPCPSMRVRKVTNGRRRIGHLMGA